VIVVGDAPIVTVGAPGAVTVTVVFAVVVPPGPVAVALYVVVAVGVTAWVPPPAAKVNVVLSVLSEITTWVALLAVVLSVEAPPMLTVFGSAVMATVGAAGGGVVADVLLPHEVKIASETATPEISEASSNRRAPEIRAVQNLLRV